MYKICFHLTSEFLYTTRTRDIGLSDNEIKMCVFLVNHWRYILNCSNIGASTQNNDFCFTLN